MLVNNKSNKGQYKTSKMRIIWCLYGVLDESNRAFKGLCIVFVLVKNIGPISTNSNISLLTTDIISIHYISQYTCT